ncbi:MAG: hypothetical protein ACJ76J_05245 [Thermoanaerobaculia bacterium]
MDSDAFQESVRHLSTLGFTLTVVVQASSPTDIRGAEIVVPRAAGLVLERWPGQWPGAVRIAYEMKGSTAWKSTSNASWT